MRSLILAAKRHWKRILKFLGVAGLIDLLKEFVRAKIMDWAYQRLGGFGQWMLDYPIAVLTLGIVAVLLALVVVAVKESRAKEFSHVLDITERPYEMARLSRTWSACFSIAVFAFAMATAYSTYKYYWIKSAPEITVLGYQIVLFKPNFNPFANVFFQNIGGSGKLAIYSSSGLSPTTANPAAIRRELEENNRKVVAEDGGLAFSTAPMEKGWFTVMGPSLSANQADSLKTGKYCFYFSGTILANGGNSHRYDFCGFVVGDKPNVIIQCPEIDGKIP